MPVTPALSMRIHTVIQYYIYLKPVRGVKNSKINTILHTLKTCTCSIKNPMEKKQKQKTNKRENKTRQSQKSKTKQNKKQKQTKKQKTKKPKTRGDTEHKGKEG